MERTWTGISVHTSVEGVTATIGGHNVGQPSLRVASGHMGADSSLLYSLETPDISHTFLRKQRPRKKLPHRPYPWKEEEKEPRLCQKKTEG